MDRRSFLKNAGLAGGAAAAATTLAAPALSQNKQEWRMVTTWPKNFPGLGVGAQRLADRITAASDGRLTIRVFSAGELVPPLQSLDAVIDGSAEMSHGAAYYWQNKSVALTFFTGVPYGMTSRELSAWVRFMGGQEIWDEIYDQFGVQAFLSGDTGNQAGGWFRNELTGVSDVEGIRFRTPRARLLPDLQELLLPELQRAGPGDRTRRRQGEVPGASRRSAGNRPLVQRGRIRPCRGRFRRQRSPRPQRARRGARRAGEAVPRRDP